MRSFLMFFLAVFFPYAPESLHWETRNERPQPQGFTFTLVGQGQEGRLFVICKRRICIFPPLAGALPTSKPSKEFIENLKEFHRFYTKNLRNLLASESQPDNLWWVMVLLRPEGKNKKWCIEVDIAEEKRSAKRILIARLFLSEKEGFNAEAAAEEAAKSTKAKIFPDRELQKLSPKLFR